jgi:hypothetical protein
MEMKMRHLLVALTLALAAIVPAKAADRDEMLDMLAMSLAYDTYCNPGILKDRTFEVMTFIVKPNEGETYFAAAKVKHLLDKFGKTTFCRLGYEQNFESKIKALNEATEQVPK